MAESRRVVRWTAGARADLHSVLEFVRERSRLGADQLLQSFLERSDSLGSLSSRSRMVPEVSDPAIRETLLHSYRILYRVHQDHVLILAVIHGARDFERWRRDRE